MPETSFETALDKIKGNAPKECKRHLLNYFKAPLFEKEIASRAILAEINLDENLIDNGKKKESCTAIWELTVAEGRRLSRILKGRII